MTQTKLTPGVQYLHDRIREADQTVALLLEQNAAQAARIAALEARLTPRQRADLEGK